MSKMLPLVTYVPVDRHMLSSMQARKDAVRCRLSLWVTLCVSVTRLWGVVTDGSIVQARLLYVTVTI